MARETRERVIRASEIAQYLFCAQAWWLGSVRGLPSAHGRRMAVGKLDHRRHGWQVRASASLARLAYVILALAAVAGVAALLQQLLR